jgi:hypothetical protein
MVDDTEVGQQAARHRQEPGTGHIRITTNYRGEKRNIPEWIRTTNLRLRRRALGVGEKSRKSPEIYSILSIQEQFANKCNQLQIQARIRGNSSEKW